MAQPLLPDPAAVAAGAAAFLGCVTPPGQNALRCFVEGHPMDFGRQYAPPSLLTDYGGLGGAYCHRCGFVPGASVVRSRQERGRLPLRWFGVEYPPMFPRVDA